MSSLEIVLIAGSPSRSSRSATLLGRLAAAAEARGFTTTTIEVRDLPAAELLAAARDFAPIKAALETCERARGIVLATPVYKATYTGLLKCFLDIFPDGALRGKSAFPIATAGSPGHQLSLDNGLKPVLSVMGCSRIAAGFFATDAEFAPGEGGAPVLKPEAEARFDAAVADFLTVCAA